MSKFQIGKSPNPIPPFTKIPKPHQFPWNIPRLHIEGDTFFSLLPTPSPTSPQTIPRDTEYSVRIYARCASRHYANLLTRNPLHPPAVSAVEPCKSDLIRG